MELADYARSIIAPLLDDSGQLVVEERDDSAGTLVTVRCSQREGGKLVGKAGAHAQAIRRLVRAFGRTKGKLAFVRLDLPHLSKKPETLETL